MIYFDNNATTPLDPRVLEAMLPVMEAPLNPSSVHAFGRRGKKYLDHARSAIATVLNTPDTSIFFTSGGTEALNLLIQPKGHVITSNIEHKAILATLKSHSNTTYLPGHPTPQDVLDAIKDDTDLIVLSSANSETGTLNPIEDIAKIALSHDIPLIIDAIGHFGKAPFTLYPGIVGAAFSAHKIHGPQGVGCAYIHPSYRVPPLLKGGAQEHHLRAGTENLAGIVGMAKAFELVDPTDFGMMENLRAILEKEFEVNKGEKRVSNVSNLFIPHVDAETLLQVLDRQGIMASHGSACSAGALEPSHVLLGMGYNKQRVNHSIRISLSRMNTLEEVQASESTLISVLLNSSS
ncbi:MAG: Cysteine desulfurase NifS [Chlamydiia bacterium]|nr:Cysteine desulfurase NifS [Chlamydiia bacterium]MCH9615407.1 Cysteine desulfurase NifS [Chlamydiia bacterium]MCH9628271.1 Cysteine desulfurase NifS [Chlamydiia bacterium]